MRTITCHEPGFFSDISLIESISNDASAPIATHRTRSTVGIVAPDVDGLSSIHLHQFRNDDRIKSQPDHSKEPPHHSMHPPSQNRFRYPDISESLISFFADLLLLQQPEPGRFFGRKFTENRQHGNKEK
jgi:hypothetical protein